jgi:integral membrane protein (TIGR01906 family)
MRKFLSAAAAFAAIISILLTAVFLMSFSRGFYEYEYRKGNQAEKIGMSEEGLMDATVTLLDYLEDKRDDLIVVTAVHGQEREVYNTRETMHMVDVKELFQNAVTARNLLAAVSLGVLIGLFFWNKKSCFRDLKTGWYLAAGLFLLFVAFIAIWCVADFNGFWMQFHYVFFDNDLFLLDPNTSIMINMFPESFFFDIVIGVIVISVAVYALITVLLSVLAKKEAAA